MSEVEHAEHSLLRAARELRAFAQRIVGPVRAPAAPQQPAAVAAPRSARGDVDLFEDLDVPSEGADALSTKDLAKQ